ncbi:hypothetical protein C9F11_46715 (plasmid) [Streptomyces sp. YIM 121038]|uniref:hypothetical protein n=1 Tax=Streptomyces sp. YIM 121038 TaxID=2136401 RepID=UPI0011102720|nr:hypothetical protein [Streptomyces sp. YIM 121038]QCX82309.1 hypothetical protein C9F11_43655 [Streptomyces sp. YIM 121038]QCX82890.1 hypothetical protein C9F11_46715 [Streptomyces sp. YIM 121038]
MTLRTLSRLAVAGACALAAVAGTASVAHAREGCRYYYTSWFTGPNGETTGYGDYQVGDLDPEGRVCLDSGWWKEHDEPDPFSPSEFPSG